MVYINSASLRTREGYTNMPLKLGQDLNISREAKGLLLHLLSLNKEKIDFVSLVNICPDIHLLDDLIKDLENGGYVYVCENQKDRTDYHVNYTIFTEKEKIICYNKSKCI